MSNGSTSTAAKLKRVDLYIDESGQDTRGKLFVVAGVAVENSDKLRQFCETLERTSGKGKLKWGNAQKEKRLVYLRSIISEGSSFGVTLFYSVFRQTTDYDGATIEGIARMMQRLKRSAFHVYVYVDGLAKVKQDHYKTRLRRLGCPVRKVSRIGKDENEPLIRLADALAGASAELLKYQDSELEELFLRAEQRGILVVP